MRKMFNGIKSVPCVEAEIVLCKGFGHAYFDNAGAYPQCRDCVEEMGKFILGISDKIKSGRTVKKLLCPIFV